jgi:hypothetical protein
LVLLLAVVRSASSWATRRARSERLVSEVFWSSSAMRSWKRRKGKLVQGRQGQWTYRVLQLLLLRRRSLPLDRHRGDRLAKLVDLRAETNDLLSLRNRVCVRRGRVVLLKDGEGDIRFIEVVLEERTSQYGLRGQKGRNGNEPGSCSSRAPSSHPCRDSASVVKQRTES